MKLRPEARKQFQGCADLVLISALKVIGKIHSRDTLRDYRKNKRLLKVFDDFHVSVGFGLHYGWAIEGMIGSSMKIESSYLSPNVNIAARLDSATRQYGSDILLSGQVF
jgi:class 3 adenylate cyclase